MSSGAASDPPVRPPRRLGRPRTSAGELRVRHGISLSPSEIAELRQLATERGVSQGRLVAELIRAARSE